MLIFTVILLTVIILAVIYVFLVMPRVADASDMDLQSSDYAHRGLHSASIPENSLKAFLLAKENGYGIEFDVRLSKDGEIFVFHDETLTRMCSLNKRLSEMTAFEISQINLNGSSEKIPRLSEVLSLIDGTVPILIEIKHSPEQYKLCKQLCELMDTYNGAFSVQSFDPNILSYFKKYRPRFARGQLVTKISKGGTYSVDSRLKNPFVRFALTHMLTNVISRPDFISIDGKLINEPAFLLATFLFRAKGFVFTVKNSKQYAMCRKRSLYVIFENIKP